MSIYLLFHYLTSTKSSDGLLSPNDEERDPDEQVVHPIEPEPEGAENSGRSGDLVPGRPTGPVDIFDLSSRVLQDLTNFIHD